MSKKEGFPREKLILGILLAEDGEGAETASFEEKLRKRWGDWDYVSPDLPFTYTEYYCPEMGRKILRRFYSFRNLRDPSELSSLKHWTNGVERELARSDGSRRINLDPGFLNLSRLILATTKDRSHRIPLADGIYGEVTVMYRKGRYEPLPWTYPDFRSEEYQPLLLEMRRLFKEQIS